MTKELSDKLVIATDAVKIANLALRAVNKELEEEYKREKKAEQEIVLADFHSKIPLTLKECNVIQNYIAEARNIWGRIKYASQQERDSKYIDGFNLIIELVDEARKNV